MSKTTPAMQQYYDVKEAYPDALIFFRMGDFYESFGDDAKVIARELEITLTTRGKSSDGEKMPLAGIPYHAIDTYLPRLVRKGYKVAICEQLEDPKKAKGVVKRGVVRVVTPGTAVDSSMFMGPSNNYLMAISGDKGVYGVSFLDISTGEFLTTQFEDEKTYDRIATEATRMSPSECILPEALYSDTSLVDRLKALDIIVHDYEKEVFVPRISEERLKQHFKVSTLEGMGCAHLQYAIASAGAALQYAIDTQMRELGHVKVLSTYSESEYMILDAITLRNLEIVKNVRDGGSDASLLKVLDKTCTPMGKRLLQKWLLKPLIDVEAINERLDGVETFGEDTLMRFDIRSHLLGVKDIERLIARIVYGSSNARDLVSLKHSLKVVPGILEVLENGHHCPLLETIKAELAGFTRLPELFELLDNAIVEEPPLSVREGGMIKAGYDPELDEIRKMTANGRSWIASFQQKERERTGIKSLKVGYNKVFGYYLEVTKANIADVPEDYIRKQTMRNAERFYTPELKEWESIILSADDKMTALEYEIFTDITSTIASHATRLQDMAQNIAILDVLAGLAEVAMNNNYSRPNITSDYKLIIREGRHPVVENSVEGGFVPNDVEMDSTDNQFILITGPNMAGKSTYMRQVALMVIMAQAGSFVPATYASIGIVDRVFTRVGAFDDLASGQSTFMVEMVELANILNNATDRSLILLDEIGRGTSTYDGYSIAKAVVEYIHNRSRAGVRSLFATHYHQLTHIASNLKRVQNYHIAVNEAGDDLIFLRKIVPGATDKSYGIHVARLAGVPHKVTKRAREILMDIENESVISKESVSGSSKGRKAPKYTQLMLFDPDGLSSGQNKPDPIIEEIRGLDLNEMTPVDALNKLYEIKDKLDKTGK